MKREVRDMVNRSLPFSCNCCYSRLIRHREEYKTIIINKVEIRVHADCYDRFAESLKLLAATM